MPLSRSLSERNEHVKFEKSLGMPTISPLKLNSFKGSKGKTSPPSIFAISRPPSELNSAA
jgi:hypothetical protein